MKIPGLDPSTEQERVDQGSGYVHERSIEIGDTVIAFGNIGSISIQRGQRSNWPIASAVALFAAALVILNLSGSLGAVLLLGAILMLAWGLLRPSDTFLLIGTCDGRKTSIVSKDRRFLREVMGLLRRKIDDRTLETATINVSARTITGGIAIGTGSSAAGQDGTVSR